MNNRPTREQIKEVAERYGFEIEFDSLNPGLEIHKEDGTIKHYSIEEAGDYALGQQGFFEIGKIKINKSDKTIHVKNEFSTYSLSDYKEVS
ncbi:hypothetical protein [Alkalicoccobacillus plakortidis]|uniref:Uncharacterized protein n=1 Tax=Alkalicoccobacillus plakortidis TaxID=444060 RepID=A0ABT0XDU5_9BACI|nr:hypothetical protein [Alkalicoccobacillus plakortidis]MCM2674073.1 hypothetical protein [Alkalicoccobacillus plakortidis]